MAQEVYEIQIDKNCPRCGNNKVKVSVFHFGATHSPMCSNCGLGDGIAKGDHKDVVIPIIKNVYYDWEDKHPKEFVADNGNNILKSKTN